MHVRHCVTFNFYVVIPSSIRVCCGDIGGYGGLQPPRTRWCFILAPYVGTTGTLSYSSAVPTALSLCGATASSRWGEARETTPYPSPRGTRRNTNLTTSGPIYASGGGKRPCPSPRLLFTGIEEMRDRSLSQSSYLSHLPV